MERKETELYKIEYYIDDRRKTESYFWNSIHAIARESQKCKLLDGDKVIIGGVNYQILFCESM